MKAVSLLALLACCALGSGCTTPASPFKVGDKPVATQAGATQLLIDETNLKLAHIHPKASTPPKLVSAVLPAISRGAANHGGMGTVKVEVLVSREGRPTEVRILESPNPYLSDDVTQALMQWVFSPLVVDGEPRNFRFRQPFNFGLQ